MSLNLNKRYRKKINMSKFKPILVTAVIALAAVAVAMRVPQIKNVIFGVSA